MWAQRTGFYSCRVKNITWLWGDALFLWKTTREGLKLSKTVQIFKEQQLLLATSPNSGKVDKLAESCWLECPASAARSRANGSRCYVRTHMVRRLTTRKGCVHTRNGKAVAALASECKVALCSGRPLLLAEPAVGGNNFAEYILSWANSNWPPRMLSMKRLEMLESESHKVLAYLAPQAARPNKEPRCLRRTQIASRLCTFLCISLWCKHNSRRGGSHRHVHVAAVERSALVISDRSCSAIW